MATWMRVLPLDLILQHAVQIYDAPEGSRSHSLTDTRTTPEGGLCREDPISLVPVSVGGEGPKRVRE